MADMPFPTGYSLIELSRTTLRRHRDPAAVAVPAKHVGFLDLLRVLRSGVYSSWDYGTELTVTGIDQVLLQAGDPLELARHLHDQVLYVPAVYEGLAKLDAALVIACDGDFAAGPNTFELLVGHARLPLGVLMIGQPEILEHSGTKIGYKAPFKLSG
jgi:hypothetical protein